MLQPRSLVVFAVSLAIWFLAPVRHSRAEHLPANTIQEMFGKLKRCWKPPVLRRSHPGMDLTVLVSFTRGGEIFGHPRIIYESPDATNDDRIQYRLAVMETLQRCTPMSFTEGLGNAIAGRPFRLRFDDRRRQPKPVERRAWLTTKIL